MTTITATSDLVNRYLRHLADDRHLAPTTVEGYGDELGLLVARRVPFEPEAVAAFVSRMPSGRPLAPNTRNRRLAVVRGFCRYLVCRGELERDPTAGISRARVPRDVATALSIEDLRAVLGALHEEPPSWRRTRDEAILLLLFYTGLRVSELVWLDRSQVDLARALVLRAVRKGGGRTDLVLVEPVRQGLAAWLSERPLGPCSALFVSRAGRRISVRQVQKRLRFFGRQTGLGDRLHPHALRHAHATALLRVGVATELIRQSMNHASLATTARYLHSDEGLLRAALERLPDIKLQ